ncbi:MAG: hypothetical protein GWN58_11190 [Anaerolineae bacterium]|nr:hypothetical protein [Anaerolineae bacterium]
MDKPKPRFTTFQRRKGHYDWLHPDETQVCYRFLWAPGEEPDIKSSFVLQEEEDPEARPYHFTALELAHNLVDIYEENYLFTSYLEQVRSLVEYLESREAAEELARLEYAVERASYELLHWMRELRLSIEALEHYRAREE